MRKSGTEAAKAYLSEARDEFLLASRWVVTEFSSALALKVRTGTMTDAEQLAAPLRAGDALHLAICKRTAARLATFDADMATAAQWHDLPCDLLATK